MIRTLCKVFVICAAMSYTSCTKDYVGKPVETTRSIPISLFLASQDGSADGTRAGIAEDAQVKTMDMLIFDENNRFMKRVEVIDALLQQTATGVNFTADLDLTPKKRTIHFVANGRTTSGEERVNFGDITEGMDMQTAMRTLKTKPLPNETVSYGTQFFPYVQPLVMWSRQTFPSGITPNTRIENLKLLRSVARIEVKVANAEMRFELGGIEWYHGVSSGFVAPANPESVETPNTPNPVPTSSFMHPNRAGGRTVSSEDIFNKTAYMYVYEQSAANSETTPMLLISGYNLKHHLRYQLRYWKVALVDEQGRPLDIVRNHRYVVTITNVDGFGHYSLEEAMNNPPSNAMKVTVNDETSDYPFIAADGHSYMGLSNNVIRLLFHGARAEESFDVELCRVYVSTDKIIPQIIVATVTDPLKHIWTEKVKDREYRSMARIKLKPGHVTPNPSTRPNNPSYSSKKLRIVCNNLQIPFLLQIARPNAQDVDSDSFALPLVETGGEMDSAPLLYKMPLWDVSIKNGGPYMALSSKYGNATDYPEKAAEMSGSLSSKYAERAYLHVKKHPGTRALFLNGGAPGDPQAIKVLVVTK